MTRIKIKISTLTEEYINIYTTDIFVLFSIKFRLFFDSSSSFWAYFNEKNCWELETQKLTKIQSFSIPSHFHKVLLCTFPFFVQLILLFDSAFVDMFFPEIKISTFLVVKNC
mgnify:CR=1 FL=1